MNIPTEEDGAGKAPPVECRPARTYQIKPQSEGERAAALAYLRDHPGVVERIKQAIRDEFSRKMDEAAAAEIFKAMPSPAPFPLEVTVCDEDPLPRRTALYAYDPWPVSLNPPLSVVVGSL